MQKIKKSCYTFFIDSTDCIFCQIDIKLRHNVVWEDALFWFFYDGFPITDPHLLIIPKAHVLCYGRLQESEFSHVEQIMQMVENKVQKPILFFEHGDVGQTVKHAHLHAIPFEGTIDDAIKQLGISGKTEDIARFSDIIKYPSYLFFKRSAGRMCVFLPDAGRPIEPAPITNSLARYFHKPYPAANRPPPSPEAIGAVQTIFLESSHGS